MSQNHHVFGLVEDLEPTFTTLLLGAELRTGIKAEMLLTWLMSSGASFNVIQQNHGADFADPEM